MYCQGMARGQFDGEVTIYGHDEVIALLKQMAEMLLTAKETRFIGEKVHLEVVERRKRSSDIKLHFLTSCLQKRNSMAFVWNTETDRN